MVKNYLKVAMISAVLVFPGVANALILTFDNNSGSDPIKVQIDVDDQGNDLKFTVAVVLDPPAFPNIGDLRGVWFNVSDESLVPGLSLSGTPLLNGGQFSANGVGNLGAGVNVNPLNGFDFGTRLGTPGIGSDDIQSIMFVLSHTSADLDPSFILGGSARVTSVGPALSGRDGSSKVSGTPGPNPMTTPEPGTVFLFGTGLAGLGLWRWRNKK